MGFRERLEFTLAGDSAAAIRAFADVTRLSVQSASTWTKVPPLRRRWIRFKR
jgi:hypothetical protein